MEQEPNTETQESPAPAAPATPAALLAELRARHPRAFPPETEPAAPLAIRIHKRIAAEGYNRLLVKQTLGRYAGSKPYLAALAAGGPRVNLDGEPEGEVTEEQRQIAREQLDNPAARRRPRLAALELAGRPAQHAQPRKTAMPQIQLAALQAKAAFTIDPEAFRAVLDVDSTGAKAVPVVIVADGHKYTANLNPKSFRRAQAAFREAASPVVSISGTLKGAALESAGIQIFDKAAKAPPAAE